MSSGTIILWGRVCLWWPAEVILCDCLSSIVQAESWTLKTEWLPLSLKLFAFVWNGWAEFDGDARGIASLPFPCRGLSWLEDWVIFRLENDQTVKLWAWQVNPSCFMIRRWLFNPSLYLLLPFTGCWKGSGVSFCSQISVIRSFGMFPASLKLTVTCVTVVQARCR